VGAQSQLCIPFFCREARDEEFQGAGDDFELDGEAGERLAVDLGVEGIFVEGLANDGIGFVEVDAFGAAEIAHPEGGQVAQIAEAALRGQGHDFKLVFEEVGAGGDFEGAAVVFGAADDGEGSIKFLIADNNTEMREIVAEDFARALQPIGEDAEAGFEVEVEGIDNHAVGTGAADAEKILFLFGIFERSGQAECDFFYGTTNKFFGGAGNVPGQVQFLGENVGGSAGKKGEGDTMAVLLGREAVDDFVESAVAAAGDDEAAAFVGGAGSDFRGMARAGGFGEIRMDASSGKNVASGIERATAALAASAGVRVVNQQGVSEIRRHSQTGSLPFVA